MLRSWLFCPGNDERKILKAFDLKVDVIILDLEDAIAATKKAEARQMIKEIISKLNSPKNIFIRVNSLDNHESFLDIYEMIIDGVKGIILPKTEDNVQVRIVDWMIGCLEKQRSLVEKSIEIVPLIETASGIQNIFNIATATHRVRRLSFGAMDYTLNVGIEYSGSGHELFFARNQIVIASRVARLEKPIDTVFPNIKDIEGLNRDISEAKLLGFGGKMIIHPRQIELVNSGFYPTEKEIKWAKKIVEAFKEAGKKDIKVIQVEGFFVDSPVFERAKNILDTID